MLTYYILLICFCSCVMSDPLLLVKKVFGTPEIAPIVNNDIIFSLTIYNVGDSDALDVSLDDELPSKFKLVAGYTGVRWAKLAPGENLTHSYIARSPRAGSIASKRATASYKDSNGHSYATTSSSGGKVIRVYDWKQVDRRDGAHFREWIIFVILSFVTVAVPTSVFFWIDANYVNGELKIQKVKTE